MSLKRPGHLQTSADRGCDGAPCRANRCRLPAPPGDAARKRREAPQEEAPRNVPRPPHRQSKDTSIMPFEAVKPPKPVKASNLVSSVTLASRWGNAPPPPPPRPPGAAAAAPHPKTKLEANGVNKACPALFRYQAPPKPLGPINSQGCQVPLLSAV